MSSFPCLCEYIRKAGRHTVADNDTDIKRYFSWRIAGPVVSFVSNPVSIEVKEHKVKDVL